MEKSVYRSTILSGIKVNKTPKEIHNDLVLGWQDRAPCYKTVCNWYNEFKTGSENINDKERPGRPITACTNSNIKIVSELIDENPYISYTEIEAETSLHPPTIHTIIHDHLKLRKLSSRWIPHNINDAQRQKRLEFCQATLAKFEEGKWRLCDIITGDESWIYWRHLAKKASNKSWCAVGEHPRTVVKRDQFEPKSMISVFFKSTGVLHIDCLDKGETIDAQYYIQNCLKPVVMELKKQRPTSGTTNVKLLHDNARPHTHGDVKKYLASEGIKLINHPPYSPDLAPCDYWLFDKLKQSLGDHTNVQSLKREITKILKNIEPSEYLLTLENYVERLKLCINNGGGYFEHLKK